MVNKKFKFKNEMVFYAEIHWFDLSLAFANLEQKQII